MKKLPFLLFLSALAVSAAACGGDDDDDASRTVSSPNEVPEVLTAEQAMCPVDTFMLNAVTGIDFVEAFDLVETGDGASCTFGSTTGETSVGITTYATTGSSAMDTLATIVGDAETVSLDFADEAIWSPTMTTLHVVRGDAGAQVQLADFSGTITDPLQIATELAEIAIG